MRTMMLVMAGLVALLVPACASPNFTDDCARRIYNYPILTGTPETVLAPHVVCTN